jgi:rhodanese-related sulfurtransferase
MPGLDDLLRAARARLDRLTPGEALAATRRGGLIVDIRGDDQRREGGLVPGARVIPRNVLEWRAEPGSPWRDPVLAAAGRLVLMCQQGYQSSLAAAVLLDLGLDAATDMIGGFEAWRAAGLPVVRAASPPRRR